MKRLLALGCLWFVGCDVRLRAIDVELVPTESLTTVADLDANVVTLEYVVDSPEGLYPPSAATTRGDISIEDADGDPSDLELVARVPLGRRLPTVRIEEGSLPDVPLDVRVRGLTENGTVYATGVANGVRMQRGVRHVRIPFDVTPEHQPPRVGVLQVLPNPPCGAPKLFVVFSRSVTPASALGAGAIHFGSLGAPRSITLQSDGITAYVDVPLGALEPGVARYTVHIGAGIVAPDGTPFDQLPTTPATDTFVGTFVPPCR